MCCRSRLVVGVTSTCIRDRTRKRNHFISPLTPPKVTATTPYREHRELGWKRPNPNPRPLTDYRPALSECRRALRACPASARARTNVVVVSSAASTCTSPWREHPLCGCTRALALLVSKSGNWFQSARRKQAEMHYAPLPASLRGVVQRVCTRGRSDKVAMWVTLTTLAQGRFSDNAFLMLPGTTSVSTRVPARTLANPMARRPSISESHSETRVL